jgi:Holliday junction resolvase
MSIHRRAARRDKSEPAIVAALEAVGATVTRISAGGCPDLLVGFRGETFLLECKEPLGPKGGKSFYLAKGRGKGDMTQDQIDWHAQWRGRPPVVVRTVDEALRAIGAVAAAAFPAERLVYCTKCGCPTGGNWIHAWECPDA